ncbi:hypothetical protein GCM10023320_49170 [Pseudonocardia adelaidensis]|uniref:Uncharacterized protein n=1 Tax=Pseudonocardia adelaidensis TaxID=648754 RepID=A0ABP9NVB3_9PSEU
MRTATLSQEVLIEEDGCIGLQRLSRKGWACRVAQRPTPEAESSDAGRDQAKRVGHPHEPAFVGAPASDLAVATGRVPGRR